MDKEPVLAASLYCDRALDRVVERVLVPLHARIRATHGLWWLRYGKRGEHVKIRIHGDPATRPELEELVGDLAADFFRGRTPCDDDEERLRWPRSAAVDVEERARGLHPDCALQWTTPTRGPVSFCGGPFLQDDEYLEKTIACLIRGSDQVLDALAARGRFDDGFRRSTMLRMLIAALATLPDEQRADYLVFHRDTLLRFVTARIGSTAERAAEQLHHLDQQARRLGSAFDGMRDLARTLWRDGERDPWQRAVADLLGYLRPLVEDDRYRIDPFAEERLFPPLVKVLNGVGNQLGLSYSREAFVHQWLLRAICEPDDRRCVRATMLPGVDLAAGERLHRVIVDRTAGRAPSAEALGLVDHFEIPESVDEVITWRQYVARKSEAGHQWAMIFESPEFREIQRRLQQSILTLRYRRLDEGGRMMREIRRRLEEMEEDVSILVSQEMNRRFYGAYAYYRYVSEDYDGAMAAVDRARDAILRSIELDRDLLPASTDCLEGIFQRLRIVRNLGRWDEMAELVERGRRMLDGQDPFCVLSDGTRVDLDRVREYYESCDLDEEDRRKLNIIFDPDYRLHRYYRLIWWVYSIPGLGIHYP